MRPEPQGHFVQFSGPDDNHLIRNVGRYLFEGLQAGDGLIVIANESRRDAFIHEMRRLGGDPERAITRRRLFLCDRDEMLGQITVDGQPDRARFMKVVGGLVSALHAPRIRAYGEMVGILWAQARRAEAIYLEELWNELQRTCEFSLFCSYPINIFSEEFKLASVDAVLCNHSELIATGVEELLERSVDSAMNEILGDRVHGLRSLIKANYRPAWGLLPRAESVILWLRNNLPNLADPIINRAQDHYRALTREKRWDPA